MPREGRARACGQPRVQPEGKGGSAGAEFTMSKSAGYQRHPIALPDSDAGEPVDVAGLAMP